MRWNAPSSMSLQIGATPTGRSKGEGRLSWQAHILTPETGDTTHYFWSAARPNSVTEQEIEAVLQNMAGEDFWKLRPVILPTEAGGIHARRIVAKMIRDEENETSGAF